MINTILFDLDGTVLPLNMELFMKIYFDEMSNAFSDIIEKETLINYIWTATGEMIKNTEKRTNESVFMEKFGELINDDLEMYKGRFDKFYDEGFQKAKVSASENEWIIKSLEVLKEKNYNLVLATNPLFPKKAILHRVRWANVDPNTFSYITSYEENSYCKPQIHYYKEILEDIHKEPSECMMVGNDVQEDMIAGRLGLKTYLIEDCIINRTDEEVVCDYSGKYEDFYNFVCNLPSVNEQ
ncbi:HAD superfamily hydrolase (TIGR01549 family) [Natranaerovirga pectinivora]|uniref:HAD superfamily hydrolase (TIGR01549 family) n=1 Tax=Natranaerovirga pectinivora TaxID=682400 RepID=A0A4R3MJK7_9FIRM|nr:HAD family hydrolase [Natranaerovirga pectinivora]TCT13865.1 HAD superfamily hydrolase (TIGR01549 family) [Natranaerovirga pectinivora]